MPAVTHQGVPCSAVGSVKEQLPLWPGCGTCQLWLRTFYSKLSFQLLLEIWRLKQQETYPWQKPHESLQWQAQLCEPISKAGVWLWGTDVSFSDVTDSKCSKWLFAEAELKNNNHFQVFLLPLPFPLVLRCYFASIWERHKAFRLDDFRTTLSLGLPPDLNNAESCEILDIKGDNSKAERGKKPSLKRPVRDLVLWKSSAGREL